MNLKRKGYAACLLCGGRGTRIAGFTEPGLPKSLLPLHDKALMQYSLDVLDPALVNRYIFPTGYQREKIEAWVWENQNQCLRSIFFSEQRRPGIVNAIREAWDYSFGDSIIACNTDEIRLNFSLKEMIAFHESGISMATMLAVPCTKLYRHRVLTIDEDFRILATDLKPERYHSMPDASGMVNAGVVILDRGAFDYFPLDSTEDWSGIIDPLVQAVQMRAFVDPNITFFNIGTPEEYQEADQFLASQARNES